MTRPRLLDLFCGAGGASMGYYRAGFDVVGVDIKPMPRYPFEFIQADAMTFPLKGFDAIHASPPCQRWSMIAVYKKVSEQYPDYLEELRARLQEHRQPYVIENVEQAPLDNAFVLCGSSFGLDVRRHRKFESSVYMLAPKCSHHWWTPRFRSLDLRRAGKLAFTVGVHGHLNYTGEGELRRTAMGIDWMTTHELSESIPPAYTEYIGTQLMVALDRGDKHV